MKVLIADDDDVQVEFLQKTVERWGHEVIVAFDGAIAWELFRQHTNIDLLVVDWMMPGLTGPELIQRVRGCQRPGYAYCILLTAKSRTEDTIQGMEAGADDFLAKPFHSDELRVRLRAGERVVELEQKVARRNLELEATNQRMRHELEAAALVQQSLLPTAVPDIPEACFAWAFKPSEELSGDSLGIMPLDDRYTALHVLDVSGHGVAAALLSVSVRHFMTPVFSTSSLLRQAVPGTTGWRVAPPAEVAAELNRRFPFDAETGRYFTLLYGLFDRQKQQFCYVSAGHPGPVYVPAEGTPTLLKGSGPPIGLDIKGAYREQLVPMHSGDRLYLFSDGIWEAVDRNKKQFGPNELLPALAESRAWPLQKSLDLLLDRVQRWTESNQLRDDASLLAVQIRKMSE